MPVAAPIPPARARGWMLPGAVAYLGALAIEGTGAARQLVRRPAGAPKLFPAVLRRLDTLLGLALPPVLLIHFSIGSFLAMQAFFGATFREAAGAVVGVGLSRNLGTLLSGFILAGLLPARFMAEGDASDRATLERVLAAMAAGPVLACWGVAIGIASGMLVAKSLLGVAPGLFWAKFSELVRPMDAVGIGVKGIAFAAVAALVGCHEARRGRDGGGSAVRGSVVGVAAVVFLNGIWFSLAYLSGHPFGPDVELRR